MKLEWGPWLYGLGSGFIGGGAGSIGAGFGGLLTDPAHFSPALSHEPGANSYHHLLVLMGTTFLSSGIITAMAYLSKSPLPHEDARDVVWTPEQREAARVAKAALPPPAAPTKS